MKQMAPHSFSAATVQGLHGYIAQLRDDKTGHKFVVNLCPTESESESRFKTGLVLEAVNYFNISEMKVCTIQKVIGQRFEIKYFDKNGDKKDPNDEEFWFDENTDMIHPVGWSNVVGHMLSCDEEYIRNTIMEQLGDDHQNMKMYATMDLFKMNFSLTEFKEGMKLEAVDPFNLSSIGVATVVEVLEFGYMMIRMETYDPSDFNL